MPLVAVCATVINLAKALDQQIPHPPTAALPTVQVRASVVKELLGADVRPTPTELVPATVQVYSVPAGSPTNPSAPVVQAAPAQAEAGKDMDTGVNTEVVGEHLTEYDVTAELLEAVQVTVAFVSDVADAVATTPVGAGASEISTKVTVPKVAGWKTVAGFEEVSVR